MPCGGRARTGACVAADKTARRACPGRCGMSQRRTTHIAYETSLLRGRAPCEQRGQARAAAILAALGCARACDRAARRQTCRKRRSSSSRIILDRDRFRSATPAALRTPVRSPFAPSVFTLPRPGVPPTCPIPTVPPVSSPASSAPPRKRRRAGTAAHGVRPPARSRTHSSPPRRRPGGTVAVHPRRTHRSTTRAPRPAPASARRRISSPPPPLGGCTRQAPSSPSRPGAPSGGQLLLSTGCAHLPCSVMGVPLVVCATGAAAA